MRRRKIGTWAGLASLAVGGLSSCETTKALTKKFGKREEGEIRSSFGFDDKMWGGQGGGKKEDTKKMRSRYADAGWDHAPSVVWRESDQDCGA